MSGSCSRCTKIELTSNFRENIKKTEAEMRPPWSSSENELPDFGLLHFTAQSTTLVLRERDSEYHNVENPHIVPSTIHLPSGNKIGDISIPAWVFKTQKEYEGEFILLSEFKDDPHHGCDGDTQAKRNENWSHAPGCKLAASYNIMLIEWKDHIAYRVSLTRVFKQSWEESNPSSKRVILG